MLCNILPLQLNKISAQYKLICGCECCIYSKIMHSYLLSWIYLEKLKDQIHNAQNTIYGEMSNLILETYKNYVMSLESHIYQTAYIMVMAITFAYPRYQHVLPEWKFCVELF